MVVIDEKRRQAAGEGRGEQRQIQHLPADSRDREKGHDHKGDAARKTVDAVREVHGVDAAHDDKGRKHQIHDPVDLQGDPHKGNIQKVGQKALIAHEAEEHHRRQQLQYELLTGGQALVLVLAHFAVIVHKADEAEDQREKVHVKMGKDPVDHHAPAHGEHGNAGAQDEHDAAHGGRSGLACVPGGAVLADLLPCLELAQLRYQKLSDHQRQHEADGQYSEHLCGHDLLLPFLCRHTQPAPSLSFADVCRTSGVTSRPDNPPRSPAHPCGTSHD